MKKSILALIFLSIILSSCSKTEETKVEEELSTNPLIGSWVYFGYINETNGSEVNDVDDCEGQNTYAFNEDGTYQYTHHFQNSVEEGCHEGGGEIGTWELISDVKLKLTYTDEEGSYSYESDFALLENIIDLTVQEGPNEFIDKYRRQ